ncbi:hypothetical protein HCU64_17510 [Methylobacterium sp. C25]|uniref:hypothetical protein n=1 Tax=Methylobacterium sp. C25 TaxID=2721622 RepID=UPI001F35AD5B|nr:hypothetical protein [Methylobacterium sp. C25]MCE4225553.1 hypothetical protein [Methylobacterium sp. C25]
MTASTERAPSPSEGGGWKQILWSIVGLVALAGILVASAVYTLPALMTDWQVHGSARIVEDGRVSDAKCTSKLVFHICNATIGLQTPKGRIEHRVNYVFTDVHVGNYSVSVMADPAHPELATTDLGLNQLWNRTITLVVGAGAIVAIILGAIVGTLRRRRRPAEAGA